MTGQEKAEFMGTFGFDPKLLAQRRYKQEVLVKLGLAASRARKAAQEEELYKTALAYGRCSREYMEMVELVACFDPAFAGIIPHWSELQAFVEAWSKDGQSKRPSPISSQPTVECPPS